MSRNRRIGPGRGLGRASETAESSSRVFALDALVADQLATITPGATRIFETTNGCVIRVTARPSPRGKKRRLDVTVENGSHGTSGKPSRSERKAND